MFSILNTILKSKCYVYKKVSLAHPYQMYWQYELFCYERSYLCRKIMTESDWLNSKFKWNSNDSNQPGHRHIFDLKLCIPIERIGCTTIADQQFRTFSQHSWKLYKQYDIAYIFVRQISYFRYFLAFIFRLCCTGAVFCTTYREHSALSNANTNTIYNKWGAHHCCIRICDAFKYALCSLYVVQNII